MSDVTIRKALEKHLATLAPSISNAYENVNFIPVTGTPYQSINLIPATPDNEVMGFKYYRAIGILQVTLFYSLNTGANSAQARAELTKTHFVRGTTIIESGLSIIVTRTPTIGAGMVIGDRYVVPISIFYQCDINL